MLWVCFKHHDRYDQWFFCAFQAQSIRMTSDNSQSAVAPIEHLTIIAAPGLFVILWASGFIGAKLGLPYAGAADLPVLAHVWRGALVECDCTSARPKWPDRTGLLDSCAIGGSCTLLSWRRVHFDRNGLPAALSRSSSTAALADLDDRQSTARRTSGPATVGWSTPWYCWRILVVQDNDGRWGYAARVASVAVAR